MVSAVEKARLEEPPLPGGLAATWHDCLDAWLEGQRRVALARAEALVVGLDELKSDDRDRFALWLCQRLFDESRAWRGQFGGGLSPTEAGFQRPVDWALSLHPLTTGVAVPYVVAACNRGEMGASLRWLYQCLVGLASRLTPGDREKLDATLWATCGPDATPKDALMTAAKTDLLARPWLARLDARTDDLIPPSR